MDSLDFLLLTVEGSFEVDNLKQNLPAFHEPINHLSGYFELTLAALTCILFFFLRHETLSSSSIAKFTPRLLL